MGIIDVNFLSCFKIGKFHNSFIARALNFCCFSWKQYSGISKPSHQLVIAQDKLFIPIFLVKVTAALSDMH